MQNFFAVLMADLFICKVGQDVVRQVVDRQDMAGQDIDGQIDSSR